MFLNYKDIEVAPAPTAATAVEPTVPCIIGDVGTDGGDADGAVVVVVVVVVAVTDWTKTGTLIEGDTIVALFADDVLEEADVV